MTAPFRECAITEPDTSFSVTPPFRFSASISPSTFSTLMSPPFMHFNWSEDRRGTTTIRSPPCLKISALMVTMLFSSRMSKSVGAGNFEPPHAVSSRGCDSRPRRERGGSAFDRYILAVFAAYRDAASHHAECGWPAAARHRAAGR